VRPAARPGGRSELGLTHVPEPPYKYPPFSAYLLFARFANSILEPLLDRTHVHSIQVTMAEESEAPICGAPYGQPSENRVSYRRRRRSHSPRRHPGPRAVT
jgi:hypothetical protein